MKDDGTRAAWHLSEFVIDKAEQTVISSSVHGGLLVQDIVTPETLLYLQEVSSSLLKGKLIDFRSANAHSLTGRGLPPGILCSMIVFQWFPSG